MRDAVIGEVGLGLAAERYQFQHRIAVVIGTLEHVGFKIRGSAVDVAVRTDMGQANSPCKNPASCGKQQANISIKSPTPYIRII